MIKLLLVVLSFTFLTYGNAQSTKHVINLDLSSTTNPTIPNFKYLNYLESLDLSNNELTEIPEWVQNLTSLKRLYLNNNQIDKIPEWIGKLTNLEELHLENNKLTKIPKSVGELNNLISLLVNDNQITKIHPAIAGLPDLRFIDVSHNQLTSFPKMEEVTTPPRYKKNKEHSTIRIESNRLSMREKNLLHQLYDYRVYL